MGLEAFFTSMRHVQGHELDSLKSRVRASDRNRRRHLRTMETRIETLEEGLGRVALLARTLAELGLARGAFTRDELWDRLVECDLLDGEATGRLDPAVVMPDEERLSDLEPIDPPPAPDDVGPAPTD